MASLPSIFEQNSKWASEINADDPDFFPQLAQQQTPEFLWIGCSDSRVPPTQLINGAPGDLFVHRNIANVIVHTDLNSLSVIQYAVEVLQVKHVVICGHYGCGGVKAAMSDQDNGLIDNWLRHIKNVQRLHTDTLQSLSEEEQADKLCELNVQEQVINMCQTPIVQKAWTQGSTPSVHGLIYDLEDGTLKELVRGVSSPAELNDRFNIR